MMIRATKLTDFSAFFGEFGSKGVETGEILNFSIFENFLKNIFLFGLNNFFLQNYPSEFPSPHLP